MPRLCPLLGQTLVVKAAACTEIAAHLADRFLTVAHLTRGRTTGNCFTSPGEGDFDLFELSRLRAIDAVHGYFPAAVITA